MEQINEAIDEYASELYSTESTTEQSRATYNPAP